MSLDFEDVLELDLRDKVLAVTLNRPEQHNALNNILIDRLAELFKTLASREDIRVVILTGAGKSFSAGADLATFKNIEHHTFDQALEQGQSIFDLMKAVNDCPLPVVGRINGAAIGGGLGLVCCCDITVAVDTAQFGFSESRLGLVPAVISPFVIPKIGSGWARELYLTGERFGADFARWLGLVNHVVNREELDSLVENRVEQLLSAAPGAQTAAKRLISHIADSSIPNIRGFTTDIFARRWIDQETREGVTAFLEKRKPDWQ